MSVHQRICPPAAKESSQNVCFDLPVHSVQQYARWTWQAPTSRSSRQYSPPSNLPTTYHRQWQWMRKRRIKRNKARFISTGPIHQVLSGTRNGRLSICHSQKQAKPGSAPSARHWIIVCQKKTSEKVALCQELSRAASQGPKQPAPNPISHLPAISWKRRRRIIAPCDINYRSRWINTCISRKKWPGNEIKVGPKLHGLVQLESCKRLVPEENHLWWGANQHFV